MATPSTSTASPPAAFMRPPPARSDSVQSLPSDSSGSTAKDVHSHKAIERSHLSSVSLTHAYRLPLPVLAFSSPICSLSLVNHSCTISYNSDLALRIRRPKVKISDPLSSRSREAFERVSPMRHTRLLITCLMLPSLTWRSIPLQDPHLLWGATNVKQPATTTTTVITITTLLLKAALLLEAPLHPSERTIQMCPHSHLDHQPLQMGATFSMDMVAMARVCSPRSSLLLPPHRHAPS